MPLHHSLNGGGIKSSLISCSIFFQNVLLVCQHGYLHIIYPKIKAHQALSTFNEKSPGYGLSNMCSLLVYFLWTVPAFTDDAIIQELFCIQACNYVYMCTMYLTFVPDKKIRNVQTFIHIQYNMIL